MWCMELAVALSLLTPPPPAPVPRGANIRKDQENSLAPSACHSDWRGPRSVYCSVLCGLSALTSQLRPPIWECYKVVLIGRWSFESTKH